MQGIREENLASTIRGGFLLAGIAVLVSCGSGSSNVEGGTTESASNKVVNDSTKSYRLVSASKRMLDSDGLLSGIGDSHYTYDLDGELELIDFAMDDAIIERRSYSSEGVDCWRALVSADMGSGLVEVGIEDWAGFESVYAGENSSLNLTCDASTPYYAEEISALGIDSSWAYLPVPQVSKSFNESGQLTRRSESFVLVEPQPSAVDPMVYEDTAVEYLSVTELFYSADGVLDLMTETFSKTSRIADQVIHIEDSSHHYNYSIDGAVNVSVEFNVNGELLDSYQLTAQYEPAECGDFLFERSQKMLPDLFQLCLIKP